MTWRAITEARLESFVQRNETDVSYGACVEGRNNSQRSLSMLSILRIGDEVSSLRGGEGFLDFLDLSL